MLPEQFLARMEKQLGAEYPDFLASMGEAPHHALRLNPRKIQLENLGELPFWEARDLEISKVPWAERGFYYKENEQPGKHPFHEAGVYYIQEPSAMAPVSFLDVHPGERVLDLCAAPGGKTGQLADALRGEGILISNEIHPARARILSENVERMGIENAIVTNEEPKVLAARFSEYFDKILVDAPCSGEGMFRKSETAVVEWSEEAVEHCAKRQEEILSHAAGMLRPGGRLVYSTCTFSPLENEGTISRFLREHKDFSLLKLPLPEGFSTGKGSYVEEPDPEIGRTMRLMPHKLRGEGHFLAVLKKSGEEDIEFPQGGLSVLHPGLKPKEYEEFTAFCKESLPGFDREGIFLCFGDQYYLGPKDMPDLKGLKVLRPGLHLGTGKKNRFEPAHALALACKKEDAELYLSLTANGSAVRKFLEGQSLTLGESQVPEAVCRGKDNAMLHEAKGWCLICVEGYSLGWGKLTGNIVKNHYPKGLRKHFED